MTANCVATSITKNSPAKKIAVSQFQRVLGFGFALYLLRILDPRCATKASRPNGESRHGKEIGNVKQQHQVAG